MLIVVFFAGYASCAETQRAVITNQRRIALLVTLSHCALKCSARKRYQTTQN